MSVREGLVAVRKLLDSPESWTQGAMVRDSNDYSGADYRFAGASKWCLLGAVYEIVWDPKKAKELLVSIKSSIPVEDIVGWNDSLYRNHSEILEVLDRAIFLEKDTEVPPLNKRVFEEVD